MGVTVGLPISHIGGEAIGVDVHVTEKVEIGVETLELAPIEIELQKTGVEINGTRLGVLMELSIHVSPILGPGSLNGVGSF